ncbi:hypothetical protein ACFL57_01475 [Candidatus Margulisiibacteriota bacterium]
MTTEITINEIYSMAANMEQSAIELYNKLAEMASDDNIKQAYLGLTAIESKHKVTFNNMFENSKNDQAEAKQAGSSDLYLKALMDGIVPEDISSLPQRITSNKDALELALFHEGKAVEFYEGVKQYISPDYYADIDQIINEEKEHEVLIKQLISTITPA